MEDPAQIEESVRIIQTAPFLTPKLKRMILYENAARFFRITNAPAGVATSSAVVSTNAPRSQPTSKP